MKRLRALIRLFALFGVTARYYVVWLAGIPFVLASRTRTANWRSRNFQGWARTCARIIGMKIRVLNEPPTSPFLLVSNHLSYVDVVVLESQVDCAFIAKSEVAKWPILGLLCRSLDTIFINRSQKRDILRAMAKAESTMKKGLGVVLFPEGTSTAGHSVAPFRSSLLEVAARRQLPVHYASINYSVPAPELSAEDSVCWWQDIPFAKHVFRLLQVPAFEAQVSFGPEPIRAPDRRVLAKELWSAVNSLFARFGVTRET